MSRRRTVIAVSIGLIVVLGGVWAVFANRGDAQVEEVRQLAGQIFGDQRADLPEETRAELFDQFRQAADQLTHEQRRTLFADRRRGYTERIETYHQLPPDERVAFLDAMIDEMEQRRRGGGGRRFPGGNAGREGRGGSGGEGRPRPDRPPRTDEQREEHRRSRLDNSTPEERAQMSAFVDAMRERREERGLPPMRRPGGR